MKCISKFFIATILLWNPFSTLHARTCAKKLIVTERLLIAGAVSSTLAIPVYGIGFVTMGLAIYSKKTVERNIMRLNAASTIAEDQNTVDKDRKGSDIDKAYKIFDKFYENLIKKYPTTKLSKAEVVDWLNKVNHMEVGKQACEALTCDSISKAFFAEGKMEGWQQIKQEQDKLNERNAEAAQYRNEKNLDFRTHMIFDEDVIEID